jgi:hypothetical protein
VGGTDTGRTCDALGRAVDVAIGRVGIRATAIGAALSHGLRSRTLIAIINARPLAATRQRAG